MSQIDITTGRSPSLPTLEANEPVVPPTWALWERRLIDVMNEAGVAFVRRYTRPDGTILWRDDWPGMDGSDDAYESFYTFPLLYLIGGSEEIHQLARKEWDAITWQWTEYGQVYREFDAYYDWMHHGESNLYLYFLALADPTVLMDRQRAARFAGFYIGEDPEAANYDAERRLIRSPLNGSRGPRLEISREDWSTHRDVLRHFPAPFEDVPGIPPGARAEWNDDAIFTSILEMMNRRMARGDVPLNLLATSLVTHAYLYDGAQKYRDWVLDYLNAWRQRTEVNGGITPDNIGLSGAIGEYMEGKWWGGYYGYRWPHGVNNLLEAVVVAGANAVLLTGDPSHLDLARSQLDLQWSLGREEDGEWRVPHKHLDAGWTDFRPMSPALPIQMWNISQTAEDLARITRLPSPERWNRELTVRAVGWAPGAAWFRYIAGSFPDFPETILQATYREVCRTLDLIRSDTADPKSVYIQHWVERDPVQCEALVQLTMGAPYPIYHGGLLHCRVCYFDPEKRRPGLPDDVAALGEKIEAEGFRLNLVNLDPLRPRRVVAQAGAFGEHRFTGVRTADGKTERSLDSPWLEIALGPGAGVTLDLATARYANEPRYRHPWEPAVQDRDLIQQRTPDVDPGALLFFPDWE